ncbi:glycerate kinase [Actinoplanes subtropicus]|uniref:glycerate kinase family protein n=1 Tax=Actinoplanes subtropicus TaxID=543632 RepID=UPI0014702A17|nr:glycerate kinase [Actinoplanes subtropicus]
MTNCFRGTLTSAVVARAAADGARAAGPSVSVVAVPLADGGDGSQEQWLRLVGGREVPAQARDPLGRPVEAGYAVAEDGTAFIEMAAASGLRLLTGAARDPLRSNTFGTGQLILAAAARGARWIVIGAGGSATLDMGAGALAALGVRFLDGSGRARSPVPSELHEIAAVDTSRLSPLLRGVELTVLSDVRTPLADNARLFGPQKGMDPRTVSRFETMLRALSEHLLPAGSAGLSRPWYGAGGGLASGLSRIGATASSGSQFFLALAGVESLMGDADLVITGEGRVDPSSADGKLPLAVAAMAARHGVPCTVVSATADIPGHLLPPGTRCLPLSENGSEVGAADIRRAAERIVREHHTRLCADPAPR